MFRSTRRRFSGIWEVAKLQYQNCQYTSLPKSDWRNFYFITHRFLRKFLKQRVVLSNKYGSGDIVDRARKYIINSETMKFPSVDSNLSDIFYCDTDGNLCVRRDQNLWKFSVPVNDGAMVRCILQERITSEWVCGILSTKFLILKHECFPNINIPNQKPEKKRGVHWKLNSIKLIRKR
jgi:hypothetical protein